jgi:hypothetical protein
MSHLGGSLNATCIGDCPPQPASGILTPGVITEGRRVHG